MPGTGTATAGAAERWGPPAGGVRPRAVFLGAEALLTPPHNTVYHTWACAHMHTGSTHPQRAQHHTRMGAGTLSCMRSVAPMHVHAAHLQAHRHMHQDVGVGLARAHTCTRRCARTHTAAAQPASHTSSGAQRPLSTHLHKQHFFPSSRTHTRTPSAPAPAARDRSPGAKTTSPGVSPAPSPGAPHPCLALPACGSPQQGGTSSP